MEYYNTFKRWYESKKIADEIIAQSEMAKKRSKLVGKGKRNSLEAHQIPKTNNYLRPISDLGRMIHIKNSTQDDYDGEGSSEEVMKHDLDADDKYFSLSRDTQENEHITTSIADFKEQQEQRRRQKY